MSRKQYELTKKQFDALLQACRPTPLVALNCGMPMSLQARANAAWCRLGEELGFDGMSVRPVPGASGCLFTAEEKDACVPRDGT